VAKTTYTIRLEVQVNGQPTVAHEVDLESADLTQDCVDAAQDAMEGVLMRAAVDVQEPPTAKVALPAESSTSALPEPTRHASPDAVCPWCGTEQGDTWDYRLENCQSTETQCDACERDIKITAYVDMTYTSHPIRTEDS
jgi:hypothetical protein